MISNIWPLLAEGGISNLAFSLYWVPFLVTLSTIQVIWWKLSTLISTLAESQESVSSLGSLELTFSNSVWMVIIGRSLSLYLAFTLLCTASTKNALLHREHRITSSAPSGPT